NRRIDGPKADHALTIKLDHSSGADQGDKKLQQLDLDDSRKNGETLLRHLKPLVDDSQHDQLATMCFMNMHLTGALVRMTVELDDNEAANLLNMFITNLRTEITSFTSRAGS
uniref:hypothetical protein n=1 Tax=uncultured Tateyamaria sp. TaxID=455651 RepID=UPI00260974D5